MNLPLPKVTYDFSLAQGDLIYYKPVLTTMSFSKKKLNLSIMKGFLYFIFFKDMNLAFFLFLPNFKVAL